MKAKCKICGKEFEKVTTKIYCSEKCNWKAYYNRRKKEQVEYNKKWRKKNPERWRELNKKAVDKFRTEKRKRFNELMLNSYYRNKDKSLSRKAAYSLINRNKKAVEIDKKCKKCKSKKNLKLKFEVYPNTRDKIREAIKNKKIYYLCDDCRLK
jgi:hypothetical protein